MTSASDNIRRAKRLGMVDENGSSAMSSEEMYGKLEHEVLVLRERLWKAEVQPSENHTWVKLFSHAAIVLCVLGLSISSCSAVEAIHKVPVAINNNEVLGAQAIKMFETCIDKSKSTNEIGAVLLMHDNCIMITNHYMTVATSEQLPDMERPNE